MSNPKILLLAGIAPSAGRAGSGGVPSGTFRFVSYMGCYPLALALAVDPDAARRRPQSTA
jgi:hypothetical protein